MMVNLNCMTMLDDCINVENFENVRNAQFSFTLNSVVNNCNYIVARIFVVAVTHRNTYIKYISIYQSSVTYRKSK